MITMPESITLTIPLYRGLKTQTIDAQKVTAHFAIHPALDIVVLKHFGGSPLAPWTVTHIPTLCRIVFSDSQAHAEQVARILEALPIDWDVAKCKDREDRTNRGLIMAACRRLAAEGLAWAEWV
jgi:hypothetical protein